ncbi:MAG: iron-siderophore ABC transporter substrate-binding protein [Cyanobacteria bacterium P01_F01_bin.3]
MFQEFTRRMLAGLVITTWLAGCQPSSELPPPTESVSTRTVDHAMGTSEVPISPQRVVVLDTPPLDTALALGIKPVGTAIYGQPPPYLGDKVQDIEIIGDGNQPNLETVLRLRPDLILGSKVGHQALYSQLTQIAPTVLTEGSGRATDWPENLRLYGQALGKSEQVEQLLQTYKQRVHQLRDKLDNPRSLKISVLIVYADRVSAYTTGSFSGTVLQDLGLARTPAQDDPEGYALQLSPEALDDLDGDYIFLIYSTFRPGGFQREAFMADPIWSQLQAVEQDRVCQVNSRVWISGRSVLAANQVLADIETCLTQ